MSEVWKLDTLEDQMTYTLGQAIRDAVEILRSGHVDVKMQKGYEFRFHEEFSRIHADVLSLMKGGGSAKNLCPHKQAATACLSALSARPLVIPDNGEGHGANALVAYLLAAKIIRNYQIDRCFRGSPCRRSKIMAALKTLATPTLINDNQAVQVNTVLAIGQLSGALDKFTHLADLSMILSSFFFYVDAYSYGDVEATVNANVP